MEDKSKEDKSVFSKVVTKLFFSEIAQRATL